MKSFYSILKILPFVIIVMFITYYPGCKNPEEYNPDDSLIEPPEPPQPISPPEGTSYVWTPQVGSIFHLDFEWSTVTGAQRYELEIDTDSSFDNAAVYSTSYTSIQAELYEIDTYFWHVRAYSSAWTYYTEWSDIRTFRIAPPID
jgi:hypothetical protein